MRQSHNHKLHFHGQHGNKRWRRDLYGGRTVTLYNTIVNGTTDGTIGTDNNNLFQSQITGWDTTTAKKNITVDGVTHTVFTPPSAAIGKGTTGDGIPTTDQIGQTRKNPPDMGALEIFIWNDVTISSGDTTLKAEVQNLERTG